MSRAVLREREGKIIEEVKKRKKIFFTQKVKKKVKKVTKRIKEKFKKKENIYLRLVISLYARDDF